MCECCFPSRHAVSRPSLFDHWSVNNVAEHYWGVLDLANKQMAVFFYSSIGVFFAFFFGLQTQKLVRILKFCCQVKGISAVGWHLKDWRLTYWEIDGTLDCHSTCLSVHKRPSYYCWFPSERELDFKFLRAIVFEWESEFRTCTCLLQSLSARSFDYERDRLLI